MARQETTNKLRGRPALVEWQGQVECILHEHIRLRVNPNIERKRQSLDALMWQDKDRDTNMGLHPVEPVGGQKQHIATCERHIEIRHVRGSLASMNEWDQQIKRWDRTWTCRYAACRVG